MKKNVQLVVGEFPTFGNSQTRAIGTPDEGKTSWAVGDELFLEMNSKTLRTKYATFTYNDSKWELISGELSYKEDEVSVFLHVYYAPNYKWEAGKLILKEGKVAGTDEYIEGKAKIAYNGEIIIVSFADATRNCCFCKQHRRDKGYHSTKIAEGDMNIRLNLASDAGADEFEAIRTAIDNALLHDGTIDLTIIRCETIPNYVFRHIWKLKSVKMSDVKEIEERAFGGCEYLREVEVPSLNRLYCSHYTANDDKDYAGSDEHNSKEFLGYRFKSITCRYPVK